LPAGAALAAPAICAPCFDAHAPHPPAFRRRCRCASWRPRTQTSRRCAACCPGRCWA
jgi:hypothetical protein